MVVVQQEEEQGGADMDDDELPCRADSNPGAAALSTASSLSGILSS